MSDDNNEYAEDAAILKFYHIDSFEPGIWTDDAGDQTQETAKEQFDRRGDGNTNDTSQPVDDMDMSIDTKDPLGLLPSIFENEVSLKTTKMTDLKEKSSLMISSKNFNPRQFLLHVHKEATYNDLVHGEKRLRHGVDQRSEALKSLVHSNFDRFVTAKNTIDHVYEEMRSFQLNEQMEFGTKDLRLSLEEANSKASQIYGPVVERRQRVEKVRNTLSILQQYKFFFNLPSSLLESIRQNKYESAIRDYRKGKYLYQIVKTGPVANIQQHDPQEEDFTGVSDTHRRVFDKVWDEVTKIIGELQNILLKMLQDPWRNMDEQEKTINYLFELDTKEDPAWFYLDSQYQWIMGLMKDTFATNMDKVDKIKATQSFKESTVQRSISLKHAIHVIESKTLSLDTDDSSDLRTWRAIAEAVKALSSLLVQCLPDFWRLSKAFIEGKFKKKTVSSDEITRKPSGRRGRNMNVDLTKVEQCQSMSRNIVDRYASLLSEYFDLEGTQSMPKDASKKIQLPEFLPVNTNSIHVSEHLSRIINTIANCITDINGIHLPGETFAGLTHLMEKARFKFLDVICVCWERDAKSFYYLEDWVLDPFNQQYTCLLKRYYEYHKFCARSAYKVSTLSVTMDADNRVHSPRVQPDHLDKIRSSFLDSTFSFLDGLVQVAFSDYKPLSEKDELLLAKQRGRMDVHSMDIRILLTVSNLAHMRLAVIRKLVTLFENAYKVNLEEDYKTLIDVVDQLDQILFNDYIKRKTATIRDIITHGILKSGIDWYNISKPSEVHSFVYEALTVMVTVHSNISSVSKQLIPRALSALLENMANDCLSCFRKVERFGMGGMLQATLEIEFMHQTLSQYVSPAASETLQKIYQTIEQAYDQQQQHSGNLQAELGHVKELLVYSRKSTVMQFLCFKPNKEKSRR